MLYLVFTTIITALSVIPFYSPLSQEFDFKLSMDGRPVQAGRVFRIIDPRTGKNVFSQKITVPGKAGPVILEADTVEVTFSMYLDKEKLRTRGEPPIFVPGGDKITIHAYQGKLDHKKPRLTESYLSGNRFVIRFSETLSNPVPRTAAVWCSEQIMEIGSLPEQDGFYMELEGIQRNYVQVCLLEPVEDLFGNKLHLKDPIILHR